MNKEQAKAIRLLREHAVDDEYVRRGHIVQIHAAKAEAPAPREHWGWTALVIGITLVVLIAMFSFPARP